MDENKIAINTKAQRIVWQLSCDDTGMDNDTSLNDERLFGKGGLTSHENQPRFAEYCPYSEGYEIYRYIVLNVPVTGTKKFTFSIKTIDNRPQTVYNIRVKR